MTNFERIKSMSTQELAIWLVYVRANVSITGNRSVGQLAVDKNIEWLNKESEDEEHRDEVYWLLNVPNTPKLTAIPYTCSNCGYVLTFRNVTCPKCGRKMQNAIQ